jgi:hypothetical protein
LPHKFDLKPEKLKPFIKELGTQVDKYGWDFLLNIPEDAADPNSEEVYLIDYYGQCTLTQVWEHVVTYI